MEGEQLVCFEQELSFDHIYIYIMYFIIPTAIVSKTTYLVTVGALHFYTPIVGIMNYNIECC